MAQSLQLIIQTVINHTKEYIVHFHITLMSNETYEKDFSFGIVFIPGATFVIGEQKVLIPDQSTPEYKVGFMERFFDAVPEYNIKGTHKKAYVFVENIGHGTDKDIKNLLQDLKDQNFIVMEINNER